MSTKHFYAGICERAREPHPARHSADREGCNPEIANDIEQKLRDILIPKPKSAGDVVEDDIAAIETDESIIEEV